MMDKIYIAFGANLSNPIDAFTDALKALQNQGAEIVSVSGLWKSPSWPPGEGHPDFLNGVCQVKWNGQADNLLKTLKTLEVAAGRVATVRNAPRPLDLDIIDFNGRVQRSDLLELPHPRMDQRGFVLFPLAEIAPEWTHPVTNMSISDLIARLPLRDVDPMEYLGKFWS